MGKAFLISANHPGLHPDHTALRRTVPDDPTEYGGLSASASIPVPKFVKRYADVKQIMLGAVKEFVGEVKERKFPAAEHSFK